MPTGLYPGANSATGNGVTTSFAYSYRILDEADLRVTVDGVLKVLTTDYAVSGVDAANGGNVVFAVAPENGAAIVIERVRAYKRDTDYQRNGSFDEETVDADFDALVMLIQQVEAIGRRAFKAPVEVVADQVISDADYEARAGTVFGFDALGAFRLLSGQVGTSLVDLAASTGAALIGFIQQGVGAVARSLSVKNQEYITNTDFDGDGDGVTSNDTANANTVAGTARTNGDLAARFIAGHYSGQLSIDSLANRYYGDGVSTRLSHAGDHTVEILAGANDVRLYDMWVDQLDAVGAFDAINVGGSEAHIVGIDIDAAARDGIRISSFRAQVDRVQFQAILGACITVDATAHRNTFSNLIIEDAGTNPNNGYNFQSDWNVGSNFTLNTCSGYYIQFPAGAQYNAFSSIAGVGAGANFVNIAGAFNALAAVSARATTGIAYNITGNSNILAAISTDNSSGKGILLSGNDNTIAGARVLSAGVGGVDIGVSISGANNTITGLKVSGSTGDDLDISGNENTLHGNIAGNVTISGDDNTIYGVIEGNLTFTAAAQGNRVFGRVLGTITNSGAVTNRVFGQLTGSATLNFGNVVSGASEDLTITVTGAKSGDTVKLGIPNAAITTGASGFYAWVSADDTVTVRFWNASGADKNPTGGVFNVDVAKC